MDIVSLEKSDILRSFPQARELDQLLEALEAKFSQQGFVICSVSVNGVRLSESEEKKFRKEPIERIRLVTVELQEVTALVSETKQTVKRFCAQLLIRMESFCEELRFSTDPVSHQSIIRLSEDLKDLGESLSYLQVFKAISTKSLLLERLGKQVKEVLGAYQNKDFLRLADIIEYDLSQVIDDVSKSMG